MARRTYDYDPEAYREVVKSADLPWRWNDLTRREDWPPRSREPAPDMTPLQQEQLTQFWRDVDRATDIIDLVNTPDHERDPYQVPDEYSTDRDLFDRLEARRAAEESLARFRNRMVLYGRDDTYRRIAFDRDAGVLREWQDLERRLNRRMDAEEGPREIEDWRAIREGMDAFRGKLLELRMMEEQNRRESERFAAWARGQRDLEGGRPAPGPDGDLVPQRELDEAQDRMVEEMERPPAHEPYNWIEAARVEVERQYGPDLARERASPSRDESDHHRGRERPEAPPEWLRDPDDRR